MLFLKNILSYMQGSRYSSGRLKRTHFGKWACTMVYFKNPLAHIYSRLFTFFTIYLSAWNVFLFKMTYFALQEHHGVSCDYSEEMCEF